MANCTDEQADELVDKFWKREFERIQSIDFPVEREFPIEEKTLISEIHSLRTKDLSWKANSRLVPYFHPSIKFANKGGKLSPYEFWQKLKSDEELFKKFYRNRLKSSDYFNESEEKNKLLWEGKVPEFIYSIGLTTGMFAPKVSTFKPAAAKILIKKYLNDFDTIFDPIAGYSGRMIGTVCTGKNYIGRDINDQTINESKKCYEFIKDYITKDIKVDLAVQDALLDSGEYDCLLTCPPYGLIEEWQNSAGEKISSSLSCDDWIDNLLERYLCKKYVFVVDGNIEKYKDYIDDEFVNTNYINARQGKLTQASYNSEKIVVIEK